MRDIKFLYKDGQRLIGVSTVTGISGTTITADGESWTSNEFMGQELLILSGSGIDTKNKILSNGSDTVTVQAWSGTPPANGSTFTIQNPNYTNSNKFYYAFKNEYVQGRDKLIQDIVKPLLTQLGSNLYNTDEGSNFIKQVFRRSYSLEGAEELRTELSFAINDIKQSIILKQTNLLISGEELSDSETLVDIVINSVVYNKETFNWDTELVVQTKAGTTTLGI